MSSCASILIRVDIHLQEVKNFNYKTFLSQVVKNNILVTFAKLTELRILINFVT